MKNVRSDWLDHVWVFQTSCPKSLNKLCLLLELSVVEWMCCVMRWKWLYDGLGLGLHAAVWTDDDGTSSCQPASYQTWVHVSVSLIIIIITITITIINEVKHLFSQSRETRYAFLFGHIASTLNRFWLLHSLWTGTENWDDHKYPGWRRCRTTSTHTGCHGLKQSTWHRTDHSGDCWWQPGLVVACWSRSTKLLYVGPG